MPIDYSSNYFYFPVLTTSFFTFISNPPKRNMKSVKIIEKKAVTKIQAVVRGKQAKDYVEKSRRRLVRQRNARRVEKRQKMALKVS